MEPIKVALLGCGTVGTEVVRLLHEQTDELAERIGAPLELVGVAVLEGLRAGRSVVTGNKALIAEDVSPASLGEERVRARRR